MDKIRYKCSKCGYDFTRNSAIGVSKCPYCGRAGTVDVLKGDFATKLLHERFN